MDYDKLLSITAEKVTAKRANITTKIRNELENKMRTEDMLKERNETHGDFKQGAKISQHLKRVVGTYGEHLSPTHKESLDMIMHKIARLLNGDPTHVDTWEDIIGYATLAIKDIEETKLDNLRQDNAL